MPDEPELSRTAFIDKLLDAARPMGVYESLDWIDAAGIPAKIKDRDVGGGTIDRALLDAAKREARSREGSAAKAGNRALRRWIRGEAPLAWSLFGARPVKIDAKRKCRFDQVTPPLLEEAADYEDKVARSAYGERLVLVDAMRLLARTARDGGLQRVAELGPSPLVDRSPWARQPLPLPGTSTAMAEAAEDEADLDDDYTDPEDA